MQDMKRLIEKLGYEDLMRMKKELEEGELKKFIEQKLRHFETTHEKTCSVCYNLLEPHSMHNYSLVFGPDDFKKKASFCGLDCLQYFLENLKVGRGD